MSDPPHAPASPTEDVSGKSAEDWVARMQRLVYEAKCNITRSMSLIEKVDRERKAKTPNN